MLALTGAAHDGIDQSVILFILVAAAVAAFWRSLIKVGLVVLVLGFVIVVFAGASALVDGIRAIIP
jgi:hypothetical protein